MHAAPPPFRIVPGPAIADIVLSDLPGCVDVVRRAYLAHAAGRSCLPHSTFVRFPDRPDARIIALPGHLGPPWQVSGVKWISSFPGNVSLGLPRASAVLVLNEHETGHPIACMEGSIVSAARTAASAALAARHLVPKPREAHTVAVVGSGLIARAVLRFLRGTGWRIRHMLINDLVAQRARELAGEIAPGGNYHSVEVTETAEDAIRRADLVVLTTVASSPHLLDPDVFRHCPVILHLSLRDLAPEIVATSANVVDDVEHVMRAATSLELAESMTGSRDFVSGTLAEVMTGRVAVSHDRPVIFSPFGLGVLDLAVGLWVHDEAVRRDLAPVCEGFFSDFGWSG